MYKQEIFTQNITVSLNEKLNDYFTLKEKNSSLSLFFPS